MATYFTEADYERSVIELFQSLGYSHIYAPDLERDYSAPFLESTLQDCLVKINKNLPYAAIAEAISKLRDFESGSLVQRNEIFTNYLQNGITVKYSENGEERTNIVYLIDYNNADNNYFCVLNQFTFTENGNTRRPDIVVFVNGLPLVVIELKTPSKDDVGAENAYNQIRNYLHDIPSLFIYNAFLVISDLSTNKAGTITSGLDRFMEWKSKDGTYENNMFAQFDTFYEGIFNKERFLDILHNFICFSGDKHNQIKILAGYTRKIWLMTIGNHWKKYLGN